MRNLTSSVGDWILAAACLTAACGGDTGQASLPMSTAGMSASAGAAAGTGSGSAAGTSSAVGGSGSAFAGTGSAAAGSSGLAGRAATAGSTGSAGRMGIAGTTAAGSAAAGSGAGRGGVGGVAAGSGGGAGQAGGGATGATFTAVYKIFMTNCSGSTCHINATPAAGGLSMANQMTAYMSLVGVNSTVCTGEKRVVAGDATKSELVYTLTRTQIGTCTRTPKMPGGTKPMLAQADINTVTAWVAAGAPNN